MPVGSGSWCYYESQARKFLPLGEKLKLINKFVEAVLSCIVLYTKCIFEPCLKLLAFCIVYFTARNPPSLPGNPTVSISISLTVIKWTSELSSLSRRSPVFTHSPLHERLMRREKHDWQIKVLPCIWLTSNVLYFLLNFKRNSAES